jgi:hypothetical protein
MPLYGQFAGSRPVCPGLGSNTATLEVLSIQDLRPLQGKNELRTSPFRNRRYTAVLQREFCCKLLRCGWGCGRGSPDLIRLAYFSSIRHPKSVLVLTGHDHRNGKQMKSRVPKFVSHGKKGLREKTPAPNAPFPIVAIGASAGGLEAYTEFFMRCQPIPEWRLCWCSISTQATTVCCRKFLPKRPEWRSKRSSHGPK